ncbi:hypothetical protein AAFF_G00102650 [Aldrovandia affinis]|uniref:Uncharacterized protein n=1 Tax=Aldrovandia affinis TaxID=143900 RepID=A0AAD7R186_9TELE|nr:hypothetical protein AAFF_G00102650 [Aldrovandia affinis]
MLKQTLKEVKKAEQAFLREGGYSQQRVQELKQVYDISSDIQNSASKILRKSGRRRRAPARYNPGEEGDEEDEETFLAPLQVLPQPGRQQPLTKYTPWSSMTCMKLPCMCHMQ